MKREYGDQILDLRVAVMTELQAPAASSTIYVQDLVARVAADPVVEPLMATLDRYARQGRFYSSDLTCWPGTCRGGTTRARPGWPSTSC